MGKIINGSEISNKIYHNIRNEILKLKKKKKKIPHLAVMLIGDYPASQIYIKIKEKRSKECGLQFSLFKFNANVSEKKIINKIIKINKNKNINGLIIQLPLPKKFNEKKILSTISPEKDVDGLHPINLGNLIQDQETYLPCTPAGAIELIKSVKKDLSGLKAVVVGRSNIVGKPISFLLLKENCTVTICHSRTKNLKKEISRADILIAAIGRPTFIKGKWIKKNSIIIDVGINRVEDKNTDKGYRIIGDVEYDKAIKKAYAITPVPKGVGPMTVAMLLKNTLKAYKKMNKIK